MSTSKWFNGTHRNRKQAEKDMAVYTEQAKTVPFTTIAVSCGGDGGDGGAEFILPDFTEVVRAGMDLLDKVNPGWQDTLDLTTLDLEDDEQCVLGQSWPLYAEMHGLLVEGDYKQFAETILDIGGADSRNEMAAAIGCAVSGAFFGYLNKWSIDKTVEKFGIDPFVLMSATKEDEKEQPTLTPAIDYCNALSNDGMAKTWEHLTRTWVTEITKAREEGRWTASVPATASETDSKTSLAVN